jgi:hypothetical protein|tara:strand:- start:12465 stop:12707 length:243 start_codon:yes stop_codon:yes gene_type:complete
MSLFLVTGVHYIEVEANDKEEALVKYENNVKVKKRESFNSGRVGFIDDYYLSAEDWIEDSVASLLKECKSKEKYLKSKEK